jgi:hypothetical protein
MPDQEHKRPDIGESVSNLANNSAVDEAVTEFRAAGDRAEALGVKAPWFGDGDAGSAMAELGQSGPVKVATDLMAPLALGGGIHEFGEGIEHGNIAQAGIGMADVVGGAVGTTGAVGDAASWIGNTSLLSGKAVGNGLQTAGKALSDSVGWESVLGKAGGVAGVVASAKAGWDAGNEFNAITKESGEYGKNSDGTNRSFSDKAGDDGWGVHNAVAHFLGGDDYGEASNVAGHVAGGATVLGESLVGTARAIPTVLEKDARDIGQAVVASGAEVGDKVSDDAWAAHESVARFFGGENYGGAANVAGHIAGGATMIGETVGRTGAGIASAVGHGVVDTGKSVVHGVEKAGGWVADGATRAWNWLAGS